MEGDIKMKKEEQLLEKWTKILRLNDDLKLEMKNEDLKLNGLSEIDTQKHLISSLLKVKMLKLKEFVIELINNTYDKSSYEYSKVIEKYELLEKSLTDDLSTDIFNLDCKTYHDVLDGIIKKKDVTEVLDKFDSLNIHSVE